jgi:hypothetical protein
MTAAMILEAHFLKMAVVAAPSVQGPSVMRGAKVVRSPAGERRRKEENKSTLNLTLVRIKKFDRCQIG